MASPSSGGANSNTRSVVLNSVDDDCARFHVIASLQLDGEISLAEAEHVRAHAACCPACRDYQAALRCLVAELRGSTSVQPEQGVPVNGFGH